MAVPVQHEGVQVEARLLDIVEPGRDRACVDAHRRGASARQAVVEARARGWGAGMQTRDGRRRGHECPVQSIAAFIAACAREATASNSAGTEGEAMYW